MMELESSLYLVPTPIGNLEDITLRSLRVLKECDLILAEDTRTSGILLKHFEVQTPMQSNHMHNEHKVLDRWIDFMKSGKSIALISDAGTPAISDPGFLLVREAIANDLKVECLPGATAFVPALVCSGLPCDRFVFEGFIPVKKGRKTKLEAMASTPGTYVLYESPHKILKTLADIKSYFPESVKVSISREITKKFEEHLRGNVDELLAHFSQKPPKGEMVLVLHF